MDVIEASFPSREIRKLVKFSFPAKIALPVFQLLCSGEIYIIDHLVQILSSGLNLIYFKRVSFGNLVILSGSDADLLIFQAASFFRLHPV